MTLETTSGAGTGVMAFFAVWVVKDRRSLPNRQRAMAAVISRWRSGAIDSPQAVKFARIALALLDATGHGRLEGSVVALLARARVE